MTREEFIKRWGIQLPYSEQEECMIADLDSVIKHELSLPPADKIAVPDSGDYDSQKCEECGGRTALVAGQFFYDPDEEPYNNGIEEKAKVESGDCWVGGYKCDDCGNIQGLWHE